MEATQLAWIANFIRGSADDVLRDLYVRGKYRDVILPMIVLRRLDVVLEPTTKTSQQQLRADFEAWLHGFSGNVQDILENFEFRNQTPRLSKADALGPLIEKFLSPNINRGPDPVRNTDGSVKHAGLDNDGMGTVFEELVRRLSEENNEEAGEHWTPRDAVKLMAKLTFLPTGILETIDMDSYTVEKQAVVENELPDADAALDPVPTTAGRRTTRRPRRAPAVPPPCPRRPAVPPPFVARPTSCAVRRPPFRRPPYKPAV